MSKVRVRVLLADDNKEMREYVCGVLSAADYEIVATVNDEQAAVDAATRVLPDVAVLDVSMPLLNGIQAAKRIIQKHPSIKVLFLSVERDEDLCRAALETGALGYVWKPRLGQDLFTALDLAKEGRRFVSEGCE